MSNSGLSLAASIGERQPPTDKTCVVSMHRWFLTNLVSDRMLQQCTEPVIANGFVPSDFLVGRPS